jgi:glyoxylase-like metal-dependent hydrolase (beta-lactamase superfamily II)
LRLLLLAFVSVPAGMLNTQSTNLNMYWIDVEGGASTLIVSPSGESLLIDTGWTVDDRDAKRIYAMAQHAGLKRIDYPVISHFHADHVGQVDNNAKSNNPSGQAVTSYEKNAYLRLANLPGIEGIWQGHLSLLDPDPRHNTSPDMIANVEDTADCKGNSIQASVARDGKFTMINGRNGFRKDYVAR